MSNYKDLEILESTSEEMTVLPANDSPVVIYFVFPFTELVDKMFQTAIGTESERYNINIIRLSFTLRD